MNMLIMPLSALLATHNKYDSPGSLRDVLGDGYLYAHSSLFARVRDAALSRGYTFVEQESDLWHDYLAMPLLSLRSILQQKKIPYFNNMSVLRELHQQRPNLELPSRMIYEVLKRNFVFHETCHCIAHNIVESCSTVLDVCGSEKERFVMDAFLQEAFANCTERLSNVIPASQTYAFFMNMNSYMSYRKEKREFWESILASIGFRRLFTITFLCFLNLNLQTPASPVPSERLIELAGLGAGSAAENPLVKRLVDTEISLSVVFREETTRGYFRLYDCEPELLRIRAADLIQSQSFSDHLATLLDELVRVVDDQAEARIEKGQLAAV